MERAADETRIRQDYLMRMESDEFDFLAPAYVRGFLKTYAKFLRVNPDPLLEEFDRRYGTRVDTSQIVALERHGRKNNPERRRLASSWTVAAVIAAAVLLTLGIVGLLSDPEEERRPSKLSEAETPSPTAEPSPTPSETTTDGQVVTSIEDGIELEIVAISDCWTLVASDGESPTTQTIPAGESMTFTAEEELFVRLGFPDGVELIVNGQNIGTPGGVDPVNLTFPDDLESFL
jgi:cytoskeletal protein RodZ